MKSACVNSKSQESYVVEKNVRKTIPTLISIKLKNIGVIN